MNRYKYVLLFLLSSALYMPHPANSIQGDSETHAHKLGPGDKVEILVFGHKELSGEFEINGRGTISLPLIKTIHAADLTTEQLEAVITKKLAPDYLKNPKVSITILHYRPFYILGAINNPRSYPYAADMTAIKAITIAGGYTNWSKKNRVIITRRQGSREIKINGNENTRILPGDVIYIPEKLF